MVLPNSPTRRSNQSFLDYFQHSEKTRPSFQVIFCKILPGKPNHYAVELKQSSTSMLQKWVMTTVRPFAQTNWNKFKSDVAPRLNLKKLPTTRNLSDKQMDETINLATDAVNTLIHSETRSYTWKTAGFDAEISSKCFVSTEVELMLNIRHCSRENYRLIS